MFISWIVEARSQLPVNMYFLCAFSVRYSCRVRKFMDPNTAVTDLEVFMPDVGERVSVEEPAFKSNLPPFTERFSALW